MRKTRSPSGQRRLDMTLGLCVALSLAAAGLAVSQNDATHAERSKAAPATDASAATPYTPEDRAAMGRVIRSTIMESDDPLPEKPEPAPAPKDKARRLAHRAGDAVGLPGELIYAVMLTENQGRLTADKSIAGAVGAMQLTEATAREKGCNRMDAVENVLCGSLYLKELEDRYHNRTLALIAYNWGMGNVDRWLKRGGHWSHLPKETRDYVSKVQVNGAISEIQIALGE